MTLVSLQIQLVTSTCIIPLSHCTLQIWDLLQIVQVY